LPEDPDFMVLEDPEGNRFCIVDLSYEHQKQGESLRGNAKMAAWTPLSKFSCRMAAVSICGSAGLPTGFHWCFITGRPAQPHRYMLSNGQHMPEVFA
jgi:hypothetical protein